MEYKSGKLEGNLTTYWENGNIRRIDIYKNGKLKSGQCLDRDGKILPYFKYQLPAEFPGGDYEFLRYLTNEAAISSSRNANITGQVTVVFLINKNGVVEKPEVVKSTNPQLNAEAVRIIYAMPKWKPGREDGEVTNNIYRQPIDFNPPSTQRNPFH